MIIGTRAVAVAARRRESMRRIGEIPLERRK